LKQKLQLHFLPKKVKDMFVLTIISTKFGLDFR